MRDRRKGQNAVIPIAPTLLTATANGSTQIDLAWTDNSDNETGFRIYRSTDNVTFTELDTAAADATAYSDTSCAGLTQYWYYVVAYNAVGESDPTNTDDATTVADLYIDYKNGNDTTGNGSIGAPYKTLTKANSVVAAGQTIGVLGDSADPTTFYRGDVNLTLTPANVTIKAVTGNTPVFALSTEYTSWSKTLGQTNVYEGVTVGTVMGAADNSAGLSTILTPVADVATCDATANSFYGTLNLLYVNVGGAAPTSIEGATGASLMDIDGDGCVIDGIISQWGAGGDIRINGDGVTFKNNTIRHQMYEKLTAHAFFQVAGDDALVEDCVFIANPTRAVCGIHLTGSSARATIRNCTLTGGMTSSTAGYGFRMETTGTGHLIENCTVNGFSIGLMVWSASPGTMRYCTIRNQYNSGACVSATASAGAWTMHHNLLYRDAAVDISGLNWTAGAILTFHHNVIYATCQHTPAAHNYGLRLRPGANGSGLVAYNNIFMHNRYGIEYDGSPGFAAPSWDLGNNCFYDNAVDFRLVDVGDQGANNVTADPLFTNAAGGDFTLGALSPCRGAGLFIAGISEQNPATIGRYEYAAS